jgi:DNA-binding beta-propeller fold protein YncE
MPRHDKKTALAWATSSRMRQKFVPLVPSIIYKTNLGTIRGMGVSTSGSLVVVGYTMQVQDGKWTRDPQIRAIDTTDGGCVEIESTEGDPFGVGFGSDGRVFVTDASSGTMQVFDKHWKSVPPLGNFFFRMGGIACTPNGKCWIVDTVNAHIKSFSEQGVYLREYGAPGDGSGTFNQPCGIALSGDETIYVADSQNCKVQVFDKKMSFLWEFGTKGRGIGDLRCPIHLAVTRNGDRIFVSDALHGHVQEFDKRGRYVRTIGWFGRHTALAVHGDSALFVAMVDGSVHKYLL